MQTAKSRIAVGLLTLSLLGVGLIQRFEGTEPVAYLDSVGVATICTGSTRDVRLGDIAKPGECDARLRADTTYAGLAIQRCLSPSVRLTQGQYDALVSLTFNIGGGAFCRSTLAKRINADDCISAANEFLRWNRAGGRVLPGLTKRRVQESTLFRADCTQIRDR